jgi:hypothetical protein
MDNPVEVQHPAATLDIAPVTIDAMGSASFRVCDLASTCRFFVS